MRLSIADRREAVRELTEGEGMSTREAAVVLGVDQKTVVNDRHAEEFSSTERTDLEGGADQGEEFSSRAPSEEQRWRLEDAVVEIGPAVAIPSKPNLELEFGEYQPRPDPAPGLADQEALLKRLIAIKLELAELAELEPVTDGWWLEGQVNAVRSAVSQIVAHAGYRFAFVKATEGTTYTNPYFVKDWAAIRTN